MLAHRLIRKHSNLQSQIVIRKLIEAREQEQLKSIKWSKEESIEKLRYVIATCQNEMERVNQAFEEELQFLQEQIEEEEDPRLLKVL